MTSDDALRALVDAGFRWIWAPGYDLGAGRVPYTMLWFYAWSAPFIDLVHVRGHDDVTATRARTDTTYDNLFAQGNVVRQRESDIIEAVADLLTVAAPGQPGAPHPRRSSTQTHVDSRRRHKQPQSAFPLLLPVRSPKWSSSFSAP